MSSCDQEAIASARTYGLPVAIVQGIMEVESGGNPFAMKFECHYRWLVDVNTLKPFRYLTPGEIYNIRPPDDFNYLTGTTPDTEWIGQKTSWGPMQVMGAVARERGFAESFFSPLCGEVGIDYGCRHLKWLREHFSREDWPGIVSAYNQGAPRRGSSGEFINRSYVQKVMKVAQQWAD